MKRRAPRPDRAPRRSAGLLPLAAIALAALVAGCTHQRAPVSGKDTGCMVDGKYHGAGEAFPAPDGCNTCTCEAGGNTTCSDKACTPADRTCKKTGCSGEICAEEEVISICAFLPEYACYKSAVCTRQADGRCGFTETPELRRCLQEAR